jgi:hypothetical protein
VLLPKSALLRFIISAKSPLLVIFTFYILYLQIYF